LHERFQTWQQAGIWEQIFRSMLIFYGRRKHILGSGSWRTAVLV
jgi:transposase